MKNSIYALKLTLIICVFYGLVLGFMLMVHNVWNMISNNNVQNTIAIILALVIVGYDIYTKSILDRRKTKYGKRDEA